MTASHLTRSAAESNCNKNNSQVPQWLFFLLWKCSTGRLAKYHLRKVTHRIECLTNRQRKLSGHATSLKSWSSPEPPMRLGSLKHLDLPSPNPTWSSSTKIAAYFMDRRITMKQTRAV